MNLVDQARLAVWRRQSIRARSAPSKPQPRVSVMKILFINGRPCFQPTVDQIQQFSLSE